MQALAVITLAALVNALPPKPVGTVDGVYASLSRTLGRPIAASELSVTLDPSLGACSTLSTPPSGPIQVQAPSGVDAVYTVGKYLRMALNCSFSWVLTGGNTCQGTSPLPHLPGGGPLTACRDVPYTYYQNVVQSSYSNVWWDSGRWQTEMDWAALHGINLALAYGGQEALWRTTFLSLGLNDTTLGEYFGGPAYLSWSRGQGLQGTGGPLPPWWYQQQLTLNQQLVGFMQALGITPILPFFQGNVPGALRDLYPAANISSEGWLDVFDPLFTTIQDKYMGLLSSAYPNATHFYEGDGLFSSGTPPWDENRVGGGGNAPFNPALPPTPDPQALARSKAAHASISKHDPLAVWVYQSWIWRGFSTQTDLAYALGWISGPPKGSMLLLDQTAEWLPIWAKFSNWSFAGQPFAFLSMNNMGGNMGMVGSLDGVWQGVEGALQGGVGGLVAVGIDPEGINNNPSYFEGVLEAGWKGGRGGWGGAAATSVSLPSSPAQGNYYSNFGVRRCGGRGDPSRVERAWDILSNTVYAGNQTIYEHHLGYCGTYLPFKLSNWDGNLVRPSGGAGELALLSQAWGLLLETGVDKTCTGGGALYDMVDVGREYLTLGPCVAALDALVGATTMAELAAANATLQGVLSDLDRLLNTHQGFRVGGWIEEARELGVRGGGSALELANLEMNARAQVSSWFTPSQVIPKGAGGSDSLYDYANKMWAGVVGGLYAKRYGVLTDFLGRVIQGGGGGGKFDVVGFGKELGKVAEEFDLGEVEGWGGSGQGFLPLPGGDTVEVGMELWGKYKV